MFLSVTRWLCDPPDVKSGYSNQLNYQTVARPYGFWHANIAISDGKYTSLIHYDKQIFRKMYK